MKVEHPFLASGREIKKNLSNIYRPIMFKNITGATHKLNGLAKFALSPGFYSSSFSLRSPFSSLVEKSPTKKVSLVNRFPKRYGQICNY
jgi:hypothetical protein